MTPAVFSILAASDECKRLLGSTPLRFYAFGEAPQGVGKPYATWQMPTLSPANYLGRLPDADDSRVQIDVYADTQASANEAALAIRDAVEPHAQMQLAATRPRDATTRSFGFVMDFQFMTSR